MRETPSGVFMRKLLATLTTIVTITTVRAELSPAQAAQFTEWAESWGYTYLRIENTHDGVPMYVFQNATEKCVVYVPVSVGNVREAQTAFIASNVTFTKIVEAAKAFHQEDYDKGYYKGHADGIESERNSREVRKATRVNGETDERSIRETSAHPPRWHSPDALATIVQYAANPLQPHMFLALLAHSRQSFTAKVIVPKNSKPLAKLLAKTGRLPSRQVPNLFIVGF
jgi:hypothetical protein